MVRACVFASFPFLVKEIKNHLHVPFLTRTPVRARDFLLLEKASNDLFGSASHQAHTTASLKPRNMLTMQSLTLQQYKHGVR